MRFSNQARVIRELRLASGLNQRELADKLKYTSQFIANWERGASGIPDIEIKNLCKVLKADADVVIEAKVDDYRNELKRGVK